MYRRGCLVAVAALFVSACQGSLFNGPKPVTQVEMPGNAEAARSADETVGAGFSGRPPTPRRKPSQPEEGREDGQEEDGQEITASLDPDHIVGLDFAGVRALLGNPALELEEPPAKVWAFNGGSCMFNVFFFPSLEDKVYRVLTYEVTGQVKPAAGDKSPNPLSPATVKIKDPRDPALQECFDDLLLNRNASPPAETQ